MSLRKGNTAGNKSPSGGATNYNTMDLEEGRPGADPLLENQMGADSTSTTPQNTALLPSDMPELSLEEGKQINKAQRKWTRIVVSTALTCFFFALASLALNFGILAVVAFGIPLVTAPYVIYQRKIIIQLPTLTHVINQTRHQVNRLSQQNSLFANENDRMTTELGQLKQTEYRFYQICQQNGTNVDELRALVEENGKIQKEMKKILDAQQLQDIFGAFLRSDTNQDFQISDEELDRLMLRLKGYTVVDQERLKDTLRHWTEKKDVEEWKQMKEEANGGTLTGIPGW
eukprot:CAMPEP_0168739126 /NCGR_PEP_ID=MMETSP0724-20121128/11292_1 /TAXON_ID=265536 /ORGANISM="Amphiprora sp., Strain CCMP467" /LENGTH=286 /DNA_ID=CAMNT_0008786499 /DNA_START=37 /DNA_END=894 /DNA_ORIENTATION=-